MKNEERDFCAIYQVVPFVINNGDLVNSHHIETLKRAEKLISLT